MLLLYFHPVVLRIYLAFFCVFIEFYTVWYITRKGVTYNINGNVLPQYTLLIQDGNT